MPACPHCSQPVAPTARLCPHCAGRLSGVPSRPAGYVVGCPRCRSACNIQPCGTLTLDACPDCGGLWFDHRELAELATASADPAFLFDARAIFGAPRPPTPPDAALYLRCPLCQVIMTRTGYARMAGLIVHGCRDHGEWCDGATVTGLLTLFQNGGAARAQASAERRRTEDRVRTLVARKQAEADAQNEVVGRVRIASVFDMFGLFD